MAKARDKRRRRAAVKSEKTGVPQENEAGGGAVERFTETVKEAAQGAVDFASAAAQKIKRMSCVELLPRRPAQSRRSDTPYDIEAADRAGVRAIAFR